MLDAKTQLRADHIPNQPFVVLDAFGGFGETWKNVAKKTGRSDIHRVGIDAQDRPGCVKGDNRKWLKGIDLSRFDVIDLDAYGIPYDQVSILFRRNYSGIVFFTFIQAYEGLVPAKLLAESGITKPMRKKCPTIWAHSAWQMWLDWLANNGVKTVWHRSKHRKHYGCFVLE